MSKPDDSPAFGLTPSPGEWSGAAPRRLALMLGARPVPLLPPPSPQPPCRVLVVDDDDGVRGLIVQLLGRTGFQCVVRMARDGMAGGDQIPVFQPHLIILDVDMPVVDGGQLCQWVKADDHFPNTKILMITGSQQDEQLDIALQAGADGWLSKPFVVEDFVFKVADLLAGVA